MSPLATRTYKEKLTRELKIKSLNFRGYSFFKDLTNRILSEKMSYLNKFKCLIFSHLMKGDKNMNKYITGLNKTISPTTLSELKYLEIKLLPRTLSGKFTDVNKL